jgi:sugar phosphate isomerase/epimerase
MRRATIAGPTFYDPSHFVLQAIDYLNFIEIYHNRIRAFHVKDAEFNPLGRLWRISGVGESAGTFPLTRRWSS